MPESAAPALALSIDPVWDGSLALSCAALGRSLDACAAALLQADGGSGLRSAAALEELLRARSEAEVWMTGAGRRRAAQDPIWFLLWEHETFALLNRIQSDDAVRLAGKPAVASDGDPS